MTSIDVLATLRESLDVDQQRFAVAAESVGSVRASDPAGVVTVFLDPSGRLEEVTLRDDWARHHDPGVLGEVVTEVCALAAGERMRAYLAAFAEADGVRRARPAAETRPLAAVPDRLATEAAPATTLAGLVDLLDELDQSLGAALASVAERRSGVVSGEGESGRVRAEVALGGDLVRLELDREWCTRTTPFRLAQEISAAIRDAQEHAGSSDVAAEVTEASGLGRLRRLLDDPSGLLGEVARPGEGR